MNAHQAAQQGQAWCAGLPDNVDWCISRKPLVNCANAPQPARPPPHLCCRYPSPVHERAAEGVGAYGSLAAGRQLLGGYAQTTANHAAASHNAAASQQQLGYAAAPVQPQSMAKPQAWAQPHPQEPVRQQPGGGRNAPAPRRSPGKRGDGKEQLRPQPPQQQGPVEPPAPEPQVGVVARVRGSVFI